MWLFKPIIMEKKIKDFFFVLIAVQITIQAYLYNLNYIMNFRLNRTFYFFLQKKNEKLKKMQMLKVN